MNGFIKNLEIKNNSNKIGIEYNHKKNEQTKILNHVHQKDKEYEIKKIKRKKFSYTNNNFNLNKNNNYIIFRHNTFNKFKERDVEKEKEKKENNQIIKKQKIDIDISKEINTLNLYYNNINTNKNKNNSKQKSIQNLNKGSASSKEAKKISKNLSRENMWGGGGNNFLQGGTQRKKMPNKDKENNNNKILKLYDYNNMSNNDFTIINNTSDIMFTMKNNFKNKNTQEKKHSFNNVLLNSGNKFKGDKKFSLVDKYTNNLEYSKKQNQIKINTNNINNINTNHINNILSKKENIPIYKAQSNDKKKNLKNLSSNHSKENIVKNIKNIIIENSYKNNVDLINHLKNEANVYSANNTNNANTNTNNKKIKESSSIINQQLKKINFEDFTNKKVQNLTISNTQNKLDIQQKNNETNDYQLYHLNNKKSSKNKNKDKIISNINKNIDNIISKNRISINSTQNNNNTYITYINNTASNVDFPKIKKSSNNYLTNINKSNTNITDKLKNSSKKSINSINNITKLNTLQNEDIKKRLKYNNYKSKINYSSPKIPSLYERNNGKPHLRRPLSNNQKLKNNDKTYSPKINSIPKYTQTEGNSSNINFKNNNIFINRLDFYENYSISTRKDNIFSKINNNFKNHSNYINILNKRKLSAKIKNDKGNSLLKLMENKDKIKEKENINLTKRRPRKIENEVNNLFTEISNIYNNNKNSFFNFGIKKINTNNKNGINTAKLLDNFKSSNNEKNRKYSFINILKPKAISQQKRYADKKEIENNQEKTKLIRDSKSLTFVSKDNNEKKKNISLLRKKRIIRLIHLMDEFNNSKSKSKRKNKSYNNINNNGASAVKERNNIDKFNINYLKNDIIMFTIYIISKYDDNCKKIGLNKIKLYDKNNNEIFIVDSNSNNKINDNKEQNVNYLFNTKKYYYNNKPFICDYKDNLYINFYINIKKSNVIQYLKIINYENKEEKISPVKEIKICYGKKVLFQGVLNVNYFNIINFSDNKNLFEFKDFPIFFTSKKRGSSANVNNSNSSINNIYNSNYKRNNTRSFSTFRANSGKKNNKIPKKQLIKMNSERNISNKDYQNNNISNFKFINYNNTEIDDNNYNIKTSVTNICNTIPYNNNNDSENILFTRERFISDNNIRIETNFNDTSTNIIDTDIHQGLKINKFNLNKYNIVNDTNYTEEELNDNLSYIKFKRIRLVLSSNYGHPSFIGLTGLEFYDSNNQLIDIETAETIGALPKDLHTIYNIENDNRIFENIFNGENNVDDSYNMWVTLFDTSKDFPYIELSFNDYIYLSKIKIFNYNKKHELDICVKTIEIFLDNRYYNTIYLRQGIGSISNDNIIQKENSNSNNKDINNFSQEFYFPINNDDYKSINNEKHLNFDFASNKYEQSYETPYMPNGYIIKFQLISNYYKGKPIDNNMINSNTNSTNNILIKNYNYIGINIETIIDENGKDILSLKNNKYKIISNKEMIIYDKNKIILKCSQNEDNDNNIFFLFENPISISYIELNPFYFISNENILNSVKEIKIFCDTSVIFEGEIYNYQPTIILFSSNIIKDININYLTKKRAIRDIKEINEEDCYILVFN